MNTTQNTHKEKNAPKSDRQIKEEAGERHRREQRKQPTHEDNCQFWSPGKWPFETGNDVPYCMNPDNCPVHSAESAPTHIDDIIGEFEEGFGYEDDGVFRMNIDTSDRDAVQDFIRTRITSLITQIQDEIERMNEQNQITQAILGALEYRGFYDAGKYLDGTIWKQVAPHILTLLEKYKK